MDVVPLTPSIQPDLGSDRRIALFRETLSERVERWALGLAWPLKPQRIGGLPPSPASGSLISSPPATTCPTPNSPTTPVGCVAWCMI